MLIKLLFKSFIPAFLLLNVLAVQNTSAQTPVDTVRISFPEFLNKSIEASSLLDASRTQIAVSESRSSEARASRFLPGFNLTTAHGLIPGVKGTQGLPSSQVYLDPTLRNDWEDWAFFNQFEVEAIQPIFTWGALSNAINAAETAVRISRYGYEADQDQYAFQLFELYQGTLLAGELERLIDDARSTLRTAERELDILIDEGDLSVDHTDVFELQIFKYEFESEVTEIQQALRFLNRAWSIALGSPENVVYLPDTVFIDPIDVVIEDVTQYEMYAGMGRPEIKQINAVVQAAEFGFKATSAQNLPSFFIGANARYAFAPNRPRQRNPFISNPSNTSSLLVGIGIQQPLNFFVQRSRTERARNQLRQSKYAREAVSEGVIIEINEAYSDLIVAKSKLDNTYKALDVSRQWLRQEQLDYDIGFGEVRNLIDALERNLQLEAAYRQRIHDFNVSLAKLYRVTGLSLKELYITN